MLSTLSRQSRLISVQFLVKLSKFQKLGLRWLLKELAYRAMLELGWLILLPSAMAWHVMGLRRVYTPVQHIGHLTSELDTFVKARQLGLIPKARYFLLAPANRVANQHLLAYWQPHFTIITNPWLCLMLEMMTRHYLVCYRENLHRVKHFGTQSIYRINQQWGDRPPLLSLNEADTAWSRTALPELGIPEGQWFVCLHVRESGFLPHNEAIQAHRNASIENAIPAMQEIVRRGGMVVRMGDASMAPLPPMPGVVDYARHPLKSERMDVVLCAKAKFFLGCTSGLAFLSAVFGVPVAHANMIPVETLGIRLGDLSIPKLVWSDRLGRYLSFEELFASKIGGYFFTHQYRAAGVRVEENDAEDISELAGEMLDRIDGKFVESEMDKGLHERYMGLLKPGHYSYEAASRIGMAFLVKHRGLMG